LIPLDLPVDLEVQKSQVSPKLHSGCFKTTDNLIPSLRRQFLCGEDTRGKKSGAAFRGRLRVTIFPALHPKCCRQHFGCKIVVGTRLKRAGMHWTVKGANAIIALRCSKLSGRFQDFRSEERRVGKERGCRGGTEKNKNKTR